MISVLMPAYKASFLKEAVESVLSQTYKDFELIIVNDNSPEGVEEIISQFHDSRIKYFKNAINLGRENIVNNWNKCLSLAKGEYVCLLCDDDVYECSFLEEMLSLAERYPQSNVFKSRARIINGEGETINLYPSSPEFEDEQNYIFYCLKRFRIQTISEIFIRRDALLSIGGYVRYPVGWYSDYMTVFKVAQNQGIVSSSKILVNFRMSNENITAQTVNRIFEKLEAIPLFFSDLNEILDKNDELYPLIRKAESEKQAFDYVYLLSHANISTMVKVCFSKKYSYIPLPVKVKAVINFLEVSLKSIIKRIIK